MKIFAIVVGFAVYMFLGVVIHDYIAMAIYCKWKRKHKTPRRCYFWNCKHWRTCEYNYINKKKQKLGSEENV